MPTTTNFGWTTPADTDLVKDGAAAIRTVAGNIDTSLLDLKGGTTGQYLAKNSNTDLDYVWSTLPASGGITLISETTASALSSLSLTSIPQSYKKLVLIWIGIYHSATGSEFSIRFNNNSSSVYQANTMFNNTNGGNITGGVNVTDKITDSSNIAPFGKNSTDSALIYRQAKGILEIDNYQSTTRFKKYQFNLSFWNDSTSDYNIANGQGSFNSTTEITSIDIFRTGGSATFTNATSTSIRLYGVS